MNYMPTKSRKWLASGIATAVIASALSLFTVAPASAAATAMTVSVSKPARASNTFSASQNQGVGVGPDDSLALVFDLDDSLSAAQADDTWLIRMTAAPTGSTFTIYDETDTEHQAVTAASNLNTFYKVMSKGVDGSPNTTLKALFSGTGGGALAVDDSYVAMNVNFTHVGTYTFDAIIDANNDGDFDAGEVSLTFSIEAYGAPSLTWTTSTGTGIAGKDDTITLTLTGGSLGDNESIKIVDESTMQVTLSSTAPRTNTLLGTASGALLAAQTTSTDSDDTLTVTGASVDWRKTGANTMTLAVLVTTKDSATDLNGTIAAYFDGGVGVSPTSLATAVEVTYTASTTVSGIESITLTAPTTNRVADDTMDTGLYDDSVAPATAPITVSGTFQLSSTNTALYGSGVVVSLYDDADPTGASTALSSSTITTDATGKGSFSFSVGSIYLDTTGEQVTIVVGAVTTAASNASTTPKRYQLTAQTAALLPVWTINGQTVKNSESFGTIVVPVGGTVQGSVSTIDQYGNVQTGFSLALTTGTTSRNASKNAKSGLVSAAGSATASYVDAGTTASVSATATTRDALTMTVITGVEDDSTSFTRTATIHYSSTSTLTGGTLNGYSPTAYAALNYQPWVPFDGEADAYSASYTGDDSDQLMKYSVTSSIDSATNVIFTGSAGVRFPATDYTSASTKGGANAATVHNEGVAKVSVASADNGAGVYVATVYFYCITVGSCTVNAAQGSATASASVTYGTPAEAAFNVIDVKVNDVAATTGTSSVANKVKVSFKITDVFGNAVQTFGSTPAVDVLVSGVGSIDGLGSQGSLKSAANGTAQFYASSSAAGLMQIELDGSGGDFGDAASTALAKPASADKKTVTITWSAAPAPEVVYAAPTLTVTKSGTKIILDGTAVEGEGDIIVYIKRVGTTKWVEQAATIEVAAPGDYNGMRIAPKSNVLIRVKQEGTGKFSNQVVVLK